MPTSSVNELTEAVRITTSVKTIINRDLSSEAIAKLTSLNLFARYTKIPVVMYTVNVSVQ
jgi:hypothetical protein